MRKATWGSLAVAAAGVSVLVAAAVPAAPEPPSGHHYLIDATTGDATDTATGEVLAPVMAESRLARNVAQGGPAGATVTMSAQTGAVTQASMPLAIPASSCRSVSRYFTIWRGVPYARVC
ncbi:hypothetical protein VA596_47140 [Amycolatopsis sp., V23-08]|uniref:Uncharacterized protein n=1 Tax=Amycolatopsis heterodermiae TaxID=3110235 RepID=A0ABU5RNN1_9PSEU|nr:hypothetical protein [Amycolatopsis sp., V23-08]MEA5367174.1 hypothetical protein [Amycolatopsis sp., V23-08]